MNSPVIEAANSENNINVGQRLREVRMGRGLSIRALAEQCELNVNTLSLIENGHTSPSVSTLQMIAQTLQIPISTFFETNHDDSKVVYQQSGKRPHAIFTHGTMEDLGAGMSRFGAEPLIITLKPNADSGKTPIVHTGREFVYCLEGRITYHVEDQSYQLKQGDSLMFEAYLPHRWRNDNASASRMLLVLCPLDERDQPSERHFGR
ncbi:MAG: cupin domain-containing protein [Anaerolineales bacterium]|nr:cupin domain-containing protein [Anaerolineales bacterium]